MRPRSVQGQEQGRGAEPGGSAPISRRGAFALAAAAIAAIPLLGVTACGDGGDAEAVRSLLTKEMDNLKGGSDTAFVQVLEGGLADDIALLGADQKKLARAYLDGFDYEITKIDAAHVGDGKVTAHVTVSAKSFDKIAELFQMQYEQRIAASKKTLTESVLKDLGARALMAAFKKADPVKTDVSLAFKRDSSGNWKAAKGNVVDELAAALA